MNIKRIGVLGSGFIDWGGGLDFLRLVLGALADKAGSGEVELTLLLPASGQPLVDRFTSGFQALRERRFIQEMKQQHWATLQSAKQRNRVLNSLIQQDGAFKIETYRGEGGLRRVIQRNRIDAVLPSIGRQSKDFPVPWVGYMFDYQHKHLPHLFSEDECRRRDDIFAAILASASVVIVNSRDAQSDIDNFNPGHAARIIALPFTPMPNPAWFAADEVGVANKYKLPKRYFLISNQFWRHKAHLTAFEALALLRQASGNQDVQIVCTGETWDSRHPEYFAKLQQQLVELNLHEAVHILGHIPKQDQIQIMKSSVAVIQPTLFEGGPGGGSVFDAMALGVRAIVSDIAVNREIEDANISFFTTGSAVDLGEKMAIALRTEPPPIDRRRQMELAKQRTTRLGECLLEATQYARMQYSVTHRDTAASVSIGG